MYTPWLIFGGIGLIGFISLHILNIKVASKEDIHLCNTSDLYEKIRPSYVTVESFIFHIQGDYVFYNQINSKRLYNQFQTLILEHIQI